MTFFEQLSHMWNTPFLLELFNKGEYTLFQIILVLGLCWFVVPILVPYLLGSINSAVIISRVRYGDDIRRHGSGNAGMTNMLRTYGKGAAVATLLGDVLKTALAVAFASLMMSSHIGGWIAALFCMLGHIFPVYYGFKGGKGVLCAATAIGLLSWETLLILLLLFVAIVAMSKYVSLGSIVSAGMLPLIINFINAVRASTIPEGTALPPRFNGAIAVLIALLVIWCHRSNIKRIQNRTENKLSFKKKSE